MIILNEEEYAKKCLEEKTVNKRPYFTLSIISKYYHSLGYKRKKIESLLFDFISEGYSDYIYDKRVWEENISKIMNNVKKYPLYKIDGVWITEAELDTIKKIKNKPLEKLSFTLLCLAKLAQAKNSDSNGWVNTEDKEIFRLARVTCSVIDRDYKLGDLGQLGLLEFPKRDDNVSVRITFINDDSKKVLFVSDFRELGYEYLNYIGEKFSRCQKCNILIRKKSNRQIYCPTCAKYEPQETKTLICKDCGKLFIVDAKDNQSVRCDECYKKYRKKCVQNNVKKWREKQM